MAIVHPTRAYYNGVDRLMVVTQKEGAKSVAITPISDDAAAVETARDENVPGGIGAVPKEASTESRTILMSDMIVPEISEQTMENIARIVVASTTIG